jgi:rod shape-determining protein MreC
LLGADVSVGVICERSGAYGILEGNYGYSEDGLCKMTCAEGDADLQVGDLIVTSGVGSVYSYGLMIGRVSSVEVDKYDRKLTAYVEPIADFSQIYRVMVISERQSEGENE